MKNKQQGFIIPLVIVVIVALAIGGGVYMSKKKAVSPQVNSSVNATTTVSSDTEGTFGNLFTMGGGSRKCTVTFGSGDVNSVGEVYVADGKVRGDYTTTTGGQTLKMHMIVKDDASYTWIDGTEMAFKSSFSTVAPKTPSKTAVSNTGSGVDVNQKVKYNCVSWGEDDSKFTLPVGIDFRDSATLSVPANIPVNIPVSQ